MVLVSSDVSDAPLGLSGAALYPTSEWVVCKSCPKIGALLASGKEDVNVFQVSEGG